MTTPTVEQFEELVLECGDSLVDWHGEYSGRFFHKGIALETRCLGDAGQFVKLMEGQGYTLGKWDHQDDLGFDSIVSWSLKRFKNSDAYKFKDAGEE